MLVMSSREVGPVPCTTEGCLSKTSRRCPFSMCPRCCLELYQQAAFSNSDESTHSIKLIGSKGPCEVHKDYRSTKAEGLDDTVNDIIGSYAASIEEVSASSGFEAVVEVRKVTNEPSEVAEKQESELYYSKAKVLLVGVGADEQMAGYGRHRASFQRGGEQALRAELALDMARLWQR